MPARRTTLIDRLDAAAERTGIPALTRAHENPRRRHLRWWPIVALVLTGAGWVAGLVRPDHSELAFAVVMFAFFLAMMLPLFGPIKPWGWRGTVDEFDRAAREKAFFVAFAVISAVAMIGVLLLAGLALVDSWTPIQMVLQLRTFAFVLLILYSAVPTLHASWATDPIEEE